MLKRYGGEYSPKLHSMLKRYGGEQNRKLHSMLKRYREGLSRETRTALTAVCFFRRTENLCRIAPKTEYERGMPRYPADDTRHIFLNLNRYGEGLSRKLHSMLKRYGEGLSRETRTALTAVCFFRRTVNLCRIAPETEY